MIVNDEFGGLCQRPWHISKYFPSIGLQGPRKASVRICLWVKIRTRDSQYTNENCYHQTNFSLQFWAVCMHEYIRTDKLHVRFSTLWFVHVNLSLPARQPWDNSPLLHHKENNFPCMANIMNSKLNLLSSLVSFSVLILHTWLTYQSIIKYNKSQAFTNTTKFHFS